MESAARQYSEKPEVGVVRVVGRLFGRGERHHARRGLGNSGEWDRDVERDCPRAFRGDALRRREAVLNGSRCRYRSC